MFDGIIELNAFSFLVMPMDDREEKAKQGARTSIIMKVQTYPDFL